MQLKKTMKLNRICFFALLPSEVVGFAMLHRTINTQAIQGSRHRCPSLRLSALSYEEDYRVEPGKTEKLTKEAEELVAALASSQFDLVVAQVAPSVRVAVSEEFGLPPGAYSTGVLVTALRELGFARVYDTNTAADLCVCEEGAELIHRLKARKANENAKLGRSDPGQEPLPLFSCTPFP
jgi:iron only hydrogenase large subunit-like protein